MYNANPDSYSKKLLYGPTIAFPVGLLLHYFFIAGVLVVIL